MTHVGVEMALEITKEITLRVKHGTIYIYMCVCVCLCAEAQTEIQRLSAYCILHTYIHALISISVHM